MKRKTIFNTLILTLMVFSSLFVANFSPYVKVNAESIPVTLVSGNKYRDGKGNYYEKATTLVSETYHNGTSFSSGTTAYFKYEPITWLVLEYTNGRALLLSHDVLANMAFQPSFSYYPSEDDWWCCVTNANGGTESDAILYAYSNIRFWLNGYAQTNQTSDVTLGYGNSFLDTAFTSAEQEKILATSLLIDNSNGVYRDATTYSSTTFGKDSGDKIFLLAEGDWNDYYGKGMNYGTTYGGTSDGQKNFSDYALSQGCQQLGNLTNGFVTTWWLRSGDDTNSATVLYVGDDGTSDCLEIWYSDVGIAPAMYLNTSELTFYTTADCTTQTTAAAGTYIKFGSYPQSVADCTTTIDIPAAGVSINTMGIIFSSIILVGLLSWAGTIGIKSLKKKKKI